MSEADSPDADSPKPDAGAAEAAGSDASKPDSPQPDSSASAPSAAPDSTVETHVTEHKHGGLGELSATAICGNDITSSCLYVSALAILWAGKWAPVVLLIVGVVLFLFRSIYAEVVGALPLNGGAYNALLNTTSKFRASVAACLTILSYMATAVISANEAMHYVAYIGVFDMLTGVGEHAAMAADQTVELAKQAAASGDAAVGGAKAAVEHGSDTIVIAATIGLLAIFMVLSIVGISESASVAIGIFITHMVTLALLLVVGGVHLLRNGLTTFQGNLAIDTPPEFDVGGTFPGGGTLVTFMFFGFCAAMLGISGFESSSNFVEEQAEGVFPKTLRNMWIAVTFFNPMMALLALAVLPIGLVSGNKNVLLAFMGDQIGGGWLKYVISIDAMLVLSGAVLTSYVGVTGLVRRMTLDRCLPQFLLKVNRRGTTHRIIIAFFLLSVSVLLITEGEITALAGVYTISFLGVMALFGLGNVLLKVNRAKLPRPSQAKWLTVILAISAVVAGLVGNAVMNPTYFRVFLNYFIPALAIVAIMLGRIAILKVGLYFIRVSISAMISPMHKMAHWIRHKIDDINSQQLVFFTRGDNTANLNNALLYVRQNEHTNRIKVVTVLRQDEEPPPELAQDLKFLDDAYPEIDIDYIVIKGKAFGPQLIQELSDQWNIPKNLMFIGSPGDHFMYGLAELGGVRLII